MESILLNNSASLRGELVKVSGSPKVKATEKVLVFIGSEAALLHGELYALRKVSSIVSLRELVSTGSSAEELILDERKHGMKLFACMDKELAVLLTTSSPEVVAAKLEEVR